MKKILLLAPCFPPDLGGTATLYYNICKNLNKDEIVVVGKKCLGWEGFDAEQKFRVYRFDGFSHIDFKVIFESLKVLFIILREKINFILYGHINFCLTALIVKYIFGKKYYLYIHGEEITRNYGGKYYQYFKKEGLRHAKGLIVISEYTKRLVEKYNANVSIIYNAVNTSIFKPKDKDYDLMREYQLYNKKILLTISRLEDRKGHATVIKVLPRIIEEFQDVNYIIVGEGEEKANLKQLVSELGLEKYVIFAGSIPNDSLADYYNLCDIFVMPNREMPDGNTEGFGIVFLEANACGKPVIGGNAGGVPSAIKDGYNGFLVDSNNENEVYEKIILLLKNDILRKNIGENAAAWAKLFNYEKLVAELRDIVNED